MAFCVARVTGQKTERNRFVIKTIIFKATSTWKVVIIIDSIFNISNLKDHAGVFILELILHNAPLETQAL